MARGDLRIKRFGRSHAHFDVAPVRRVEHPMRFLHEIAIAPVDYGDDPGSPSPEQVNSPVRVRSRARLADGDDQGAGHVVREADASGAQPDSSDAGMAVTGTVGNDRVIAAATACPATAAVPWPITRMLWTRPDERAWRSDGGMTSSPRRATRRPFSPVTNFPRRVFRTERGDSEISFNRKCLKPWRSTSRVVISATITSLSETGTSVPS